MTNNNNVIGLGKSKAKKRYCWKVVDSQGNQYIAEGTTVITEEASATIHVYDEQDCILTILDGARVELINDPRLTVIAKPKAKRTKAKADK